MTLLNFTSVVGLLLMGYAVLLFLFPPKYSSFWYGVSTHETEKNSHAWAVGQRLFSYIIFGIGWIFTIIGVLQLIDSAHKFPMVLLMIVLWKLSKFAVDRILKKRKLVG